MASLPSLNKEKLDALKEEFCALLRSTGRENIERMITYLESTDFFTAPASASKHGALYGGLVMHSLEVYRLLENFSKPLRDVGDDSLIICGLLHDVCKVNMYTVRTRNVKNQQGRWEEVESFAIDDQLPFGHGEKSVYLIQKQMPITDEEALAIRWHMGGYDDAARSYIGGITQSNAFEKVPLCVSLHLADMYAAHFRV
jgi:hypothetical protein